MIRIGVSACFMYPDPSRTVFGHKQLSYFEHDMSRWLARTGVMPILIPDLTSDRLIPYLEQMDAFVFQGGADIAPGTYGATPIENGRWPGDSHRDRYELTLMDWAFRSLKPVLAICRGFQLMNVYFGGTLYQDLKIETGTPVKHRNAETYDRVNHEVECPAGSLLRVIYGQERFRVNSVHHQGVKTLGKNLKVDAHSLDDGLIEAFHYEGPEPVSFQGVQWHPEFSHTLGTQIISPEPLLDRFLKEIRK